MIGFNACSPIKPESHNSLLELPSVWAKYRKGKELGRGVYGVVFKATHIESGELVAVKRTPMDEEGIGATTLREACILNRNNIRDYELHRRFQPHSFNRRMNAENIVQVHEVFQDLPHRFIYLVMDYAETDLAKHIKAYVCKAMLEQTNDFSSEQQLSLLSLDDKIELGLPRETVRDCMSQILAGLAFAHGRRLMHRDLKPSNILVNYSVRGDMSSKLKLKIADFGLARVRSFPDKRHYTPETVTMLYRAPEIFFGVREYGAVIDIWSCGCIFAELVRGRPLFDGETEISVLNDIQRKLGPIKASDVRNMSLPDIISFQNHSQKTPLSNYVLLDPIGLNLLEKMLVYNADDRISSQTSLPRARFTTH
ncbi:hypothetical protein BDEG_20991, partial [Batrachochytrium dendrobatidis JEL423]